MNKIKELCTRRGIDQKEVALRIGVSQPTVSDWFNQKKNPRDERLKRLCEMLNVTEAVILGYADDPMAAEGTPAKETPLISRRLKSLREQSGKTQDVVAEACGISRLTLSRYESGATEPKASALASFAQYYNVPIDYLAECCTLTVEPNEKEENQGKRTADEEEKEEILLRGFRALPDEIKNEILDFVKFKGNKQK